MSRTRRLRRECRASAVMHDGRRLYVDGEEATWRNDLWDYGPRMHWYNNERKDYRKLWQARYRARVRQAVGHERWDEIPQWRRTGGWLTW